MRAQPSALVLLACFAVGAVASAQPPSAQPPPPGCPYPAPADDSSCTPHRRGEMCAYVTAGVIRVCTCDAASQRWQCSTRP